MLNDRPAAFGYLQKALEVAPSQGEVLFRAAVVYNHFDQTEQALAYLKKAVNVGYSRAIVRDTPDFLATATKPAVPVAGPKSLSTVVILIKP